MIGNRAVYARKGQYASHTTNVHPCRTNQRHNFRTLNFILWDPAAEPLVLLHDDEIYTTLTPQWGWTSPNAVGSFPSY